MSQIAVVTTNVVADTPLSAPDEIEAKPRPDPNAKNISEAAIATNAPAAIAGHDAADFPDVTGEPTSTASARGYTFASNDYAPALAMRTHRKQ
jgi:Protein of unknown function (DUF3035)